MQASKPWGAAARQAAPTRYLVRGMAALGLSFLVSLAILAVLSRCPGNANVCAAVGVVLWLALPAVLAIACALPGIRARLVVANLVCTSAGWSVAVALSAAYFGPTGEARGLFLPMLLFMFVPLAALSGAGALFLGARGVVQKRARPQA